MLNQIIKFFKWLWGTCACTCQSSCTDNCQKDNCICGCIKKEASDVVPNSPAVVKTLKDLSSDSSVSSVSDKRV